MIRLERVESRRQLRSFVRFPHHLYRGDPHYAPQPDTVVRDHLDRRSNPFFRRGSARYYVARRSGRVVGRVASISNPAHNARYDERTGFFGFFDVEDHVDVARALLSQVVSDAHEEGCDRIVGPECFTTNDTVGVLVDGFDSAPKVLMPYNAPHYGRLLEELGFRKAIDLHSWRVVYDDIPQRIVSLVERLRSRLARSGVRVRSLDFDAFVTELRALRTLYDRANAQNWGFLPMEEDEFERMALELRRVVTPELVLVAELDGEFVGYLLAVPDMNQILVKMQDGRLLPMGWLRLLLGRRSIDTYRVMLIGVHDEYRHMGIDVALYAQIIRTLHARGVRQIEACYVLEANDAMAALMGKLRAEIVKTYRLYSRELDAGSGAAS